jgi:5,6,7,8-tetrahydromethanopterin hydro-lyase
VGSPILVADVGRGPPAFNPAMTCWHSFGMDAHARTLPLQEFNLAVQWQKQDQADGVEKFKGYLVRNGRGNGFGGPAGTAFATMMGQAVGHTRMFVIRDYNQLVRPPAIMTTKVTIANAGYVDLLGGVVQAGLADAIVDCIANGTLPRDGLDELCMIIMVWLDPRCPDIPDLDKKDLYRTNFEATKIAIGRAVRGEPSVEELLKNRKSIKHSSLEGLIEYK